MANDQTLRDAVMRLNDIQASLEDPDPLGEPDRTSASIGKQILTEVKLALAGYTVSVQKKAVLSSFRGTYVMRYAQHKLTLSAAETSPAALFSLWSKFRQLALEQGNPASINQIELSDLAQTASGALASVAEIRAASYLPGVRSIAKPDRGVEHHVLLVDDAADVLVTVGAFLVKAGYEVQKAASGDEALRLIVGDPRIDLLVTDFAMPGLNGADLIASAVQVRPQLRALVITGNPSADGLAELPPHTALLVKPFRRAALMAAVDSLLRPATNEAAALPRASIRKGKSMSKSFSERRQALLVDDHPDVLVGVGAYLEAAGFDVVRVPSGDEALAHLAAGHKFALLVTDYAMASLNGVELARLALEQHPDLKVLIITGVPSDAGLFDRPASVALLPKPFRRAVLTEVVQALFSIEPGLPASPPDATGWG